MDDLLSALTEFSKSEKDSENKQQVGLAKEIDQTVSCIIYMYLLMWDLLCISTGLMCGGTQLSNGLGRYTVVLC